MEKKGTRRRARATTQEEDGATKALANVFQKERQEMGRRWLQLIESRIENKLASQADRLSWEWVAGHRDGVGAMAAGVKDETDVAEH